MFNVLMIDDDEKLAPILTEYCARYGIRISAAFTPSTGFEQLRQNDFDAVILDIMLPEINGFQVCKTIRQSSEIPIIMLTARGEVTDKVVGLEIGADDYLPKPFDPRELVARLNTIVKRRQLTTNEATILNFDNLSIDQNQREVSVKGRLVPLTSMEYQLLLLLATTPGRNYSRDDILNHLKGRETELFSRSVDILVSRLRSKLKPTSPIKTVHGLGYAFVGTPQ